MDGTGSLSSPVAAFSVSIVEPRVYIIRELV
jgi:hypothetical protein